MSGGIFFAVVGASGVGKDAVLNRARPILQSTGKFYFPVRTITRPPDHTGEDHESVSGSEFVQRVRDDKFSLWWAAHELHYGLPDDVFEKLRDGMHVVANISRLMVEETIHKFSRVEVIEITASPGTINRRLSERGRESEAEIIVRQLRETTPGWAANLCVTKIDNDGALSKSVDKFIETVLVLSAENGAEVRRA